jgi:hypothetical protein
MSYFKFDRHANMNGETLTEIGDIIGEVRWDANFDVVNMLYGLYDGYLYEDLLPQSEKQFGGDIYTRIENIVNVISTYPKL